MSKTKTKNKTISKTKLAILFAVLTLFTSGTVYAAYTILTFNGNTGDASSIGGIYEKVKNLTKSLNNTADSLRGEKDSHNADINTANGEIDKANKYASSISSALGSTSVDTTNADQAIKNASDAASYDPSISSSVSK